MPDSYIANHSIQNPLEVITPRVAKSEIRMPISYEIEAQHILHRTKKKIKNHRWILTNHNFWSISN